MAQQQEEASSNQQQLHLQIQLQQHGAYVALGGPGDRTA